VVNADRRDEGDRDGASVVSQREKRRASRSVETFRAPLTGRLRGMPNAAVSRVTPVGWDWPER